MPELTQCTLALLLCLQIWTRTSLPQEACTCFCSCKENHLHWQVLASLNEPTWALVNGCPSGWENTLRLAQLAPVATPTPWKCHGIELSRRTAGTYLLWAQRVVSLTPAEERRPMLLGKTSSKYPAAFSNWMVSVMRAVWKTDTHNRGHLLCFRVVVHLVSCWLGNKVVAAVVMF